MDPATVDECRSRRRPWWQDRFLIYDIVMSGLLIVLNVAIYSYIRQHKIHIAVPHKSYMIEVFFGYYCVTFICGVALWVCFLLKCNSETFEGGMMGLSHIMAIALLIIFIYSISPLYSLLFGIPSALWFVSYLLYYAYRRQNFPR